MAGRKHSDEQVADRRRKVLLLHQEGLTHAQIADHLGVHRSTATRDLAIAQNLAKAEKNARAARDISPAAGMQPEEYSDEQVLVIRRRMMSVLMELAEDAGAAGTVRSSAANAVLNHTRPEVERILGDLNRDAGEFTIELIEAPAPAEVTVT